MFAKIYSPTLYMKLLYSFHCRLLANSDVDLMSKGEVDIFFHYNSGFTKTKRTITTS